MLNIENCREYDAAANELAYKGLTGAIGDPLPNLMSRATLDAINDDPEAFQERVRLSAYALAMERLHLSIEARQRLSLRPWDSSPICSACGCPRSWIGGVYGCGCNPEGA